MSTKHDKLLEHIDSIIKRCEIAPTIFPIGFLDELYTLKREAIVAGKSIAS
jgi:hypothetical protein